MKPVAIEPLTRSGFAPFGQVIEAHDGAERRTINQGLAERFHDLARIECFGADAGPTINIFRGQPRALPLTLEIVERHPLGSQAFFPLSGREFLVIVAPDENGTPGTPKAFLAGPRQGVNFPAGTWHGVLTALGEVSDFLVIDRGDDTGNLEEHRYAEPYLVGAPAA